MSCWRMLSKAGGVAVTDPALIPGIFEALLHTNKQKEPAQ